MQAEFQTILNRWIDQSAFDLQEAKRFSASDFREGIQWLVANDHADLAQALADALDALETLEVWKVADITAAMEKFLAEKNLKAKDIYMPLRVATTGAKETPPLFESMEVIGKEMVRRRVRCAIAALHALPSPSP